MLPFEKTALIPSIVTYSGRDVGMMHSCGHDTRTSILMGVAEVLAGLRELIPISVKFIFPREEEGPPAGEDGGAGLMIKEGAFDSPRPDAIFGLHGFPYPTGHIAFRSGGIMASSDPVHIKVHGRQSHGALPWAGVDPVVLCFLGVTPPSGDPAKVASNHSPRFFADEAALPAGVRALATLAVDYLSRQTLPAGRQ